MVVAILCGLVVVAAGGALWPQLGWRRLVRRRVVVVLDTERSISGVLFARRGCLLVLRDASTVQGERDIRFDGEVVVDRRRVLWVQVLA